MGTHRVQDMAPSSQVNQLDFDIDDPNVNKKIEEEMVNPDAAAEAKPEEPPAEPKKDGCCSSIKNPRDLRAHKNVDHNEKKFKDDVPDKAN